MILASEFNHLSGLCLIHAMILFQLLASFRPVDDGMSEICAIKSHHDHREASMRLGSVRLCNPINSFKNMSFYFLIKL